jgi:hypothetical protein
VIPSATVWQRRYAGKHAGSGAELDAESVGAR